MTEITESMRRYMRTHSAVVNSFNPTDEQWEKLEVAAKAVRDETATEEETNVATWEGLGRGFIEHEPDQTYGASD